MALTQHEIKELRVTYAVAKKWREILYRKTHDATGLPVIGTTRELHQYMNWNRIERSIRSLLTEEGVDPESEGPK
ncbi:MAG TPA: hypothetical protein VFG95_01020 [Nitrospiria bacterium]|nr:hypothetical protein [Nitrospiria bacterium]